MSKFCLYIQILTLSLLPDYCDRTAVDLLGRNEMSILQTFYEKGGKPSPDSFDLAQARHVLALAHGLLEVAGGKQSRFWDGFSHQYSAFENQSICGLMIDVTSTRAPEKVCFAQLYHAILRSKLLVDSSFLGFDEANHPSLSFDGFRRIIKRCQDVIEPQSYRQVMCGHVQTKTE